MIEGFAIGVVSGSIGLILITAVGFVIYARIADRGRKGRWIREEATSRPYADTLLDQARQTILEIYRFDKEKDAKLAGFAFQLAAAFTELDEHLMVGGQLPSDWVVQ